MIQGALPRERTIIFHLYPVSMIFMPLTLAFPEPQLALPNKDQDEISSTGKEL